jgi:hypothetical protein
MVDIRMLSESVEMVPKFNLSNGCSVHAVTAPRRPPSTPVRLIYIFALSRYFVLLCFVLLLFY